MVNGVRKVFFEAFRILLQSTGNRPPRVGIPHGVFSSVANDHPGEVYFTPFGSIDLKGLAMQVYHRVRGTLVELSKVFAWKAHVFRASHFEADVEQSREIETEEDVKYDQLPNNS